MKSTHSNEYIAMLSRLKKARRDASLSQKEVADKLGKHQSYISKIESGERRIDLIETKKLAAIYKKNISFFIP